MPVIVGSPFFDSCDELFGQREATPYDLSGERNYRRQHRVIVKLKEMAGVAVCLCPGLPLPGSFYQTPNEYDLLAVMVRQSAKEEHADDWGQWIVTSDYSTNIPLAGGVPDDIGFANQGDGAQNQPELELPTVEWEFALTEVAYPHDLDGKPYLNSANQPFSPPPAFPSPYAVLHISRNEPSFSRAKAQYFTGSVNSDLFLGMDPGFVQCMTPRARQAHRGRWLFWRVDYRLNFPYFGPDGNYTNWQPKFVDMGTKEWYTQDDLIAMGYDDTTPRALPIMEGGHAITRPVLLDGAGGKQVPDAAGVVQPHWLQFRQYPAKSFRDLLVRGLG